MELEEIVLASIMHLQFVITFVSRPCAGGAIDIIFNPIFNFVKLQAGKAGVISKSGIIQTNFFLRHGSTLQNAIELFHNGRNHGFIDSLVFVLVFDNIGGGVTCIMCTAPVKRIGIITNDIK